MELVLNFKNQLYLSLNLVDLKLKEFSKSAMSCFWIILLHFKAMIQECNYSN